MESKLFGLARKNVIEIAFTLAQGNKIKYSFGNGYARCRWLDLFMYHHPKLNIQQPIGTSKARTVDTVYKEDAQRIGTCGCTDIRTELLNYNCNFYENNF